MPTAGIPQPRRLVSIAHSYVVGMNRRLAHELAREGAGRWEVTAVAPSTFQADRRTLRLNLADDEPCPVEGVPVHFSRSIHLMLYGRRLRTLLHNLPADLVHCWEEPYILAGGQVARWTPKSSALVYYLCQNIPKHYPPPFSWVEHACRDRCSGWIAMGQTVLDAQRARGYHQKPHRVITPGVDVNHFQPDPAARSAIRQRLAWSTNGPPVVGFLGRLVPEKGLDLLTQALDAQTAPWRALFVGAGPLESKLRHWASRHPGQVALATNVPHVEVPAYLNAMDLLAAPSQTTPFWREQFGRMLIEAFACGLPVLASKSGEIPHVVADPAQLLNESDLPAWTSALATLIDNPTLRQSLSRRNLDRARTHFAWPQIARAHLAFFDQLLDAPSPRDP